MNHENETNQDTIVDAEQAPPDSFKFQTDQNQGKEDANYTSTATNNTSSIADPSAKDADEDGKNLASITSSSNNSSSPKERHSSLELRKLPANVLLTPDVDASAEQQTPHEKQTSKRAGIRRLTCLNPKFDLRTQLMLSFDSVNLVTIFLVVLICVVVAFKTGDNIKEINSSTFEELAEQVQGRTARYLAESLEHRLIPKDVVQILYEVTRDRFQGYPVFLDDSQLPFNDMDTNTSVYPIVGRPLPLDWQIENPVTNETDAEHVQGRRHWYSGNPVSTANGAFILQGACDPSETDPTAHTYWINCTDANNDISTGGVLRPSNLTGIIHQKASDLVPVLKALYEYHQDVHDIGIFFANGGIGATVTFPQYELDAQNTYTATGCDWMKELNPFDPSRPIGTQEEIDQCYEEGAVLSAREYSPLGRAWCRDQALHPEKLLVDGPFLDAWVENNWLISSGRAVYDRITDDFLACIFVGMSTFFVEDIMRESRVTPNSEVSVVRWDGDGSVVASSAWNLSEAREVVTIVDLNLGITNWTYHHLYNLVDYDAEWDPSQVRQAYERFTSRADGFLVAAYPVPPVPQEYDPTYRPVFFTMTSTAEADVFDKVEEVNDGVDQRVDEAILFSVIVGAAGFVLATVVILITATAITRPLQLMNKEAELIVGSFGDDTCSNMQQIKPINMTYSSCVPDTEIADVVREFNKMISSFSGSFMARTECGKYVEIKNIFDLKNNFMDLYTSRKPCDFPLGVTESTTDASPDAGAAPNASTAADGRILPTNGSSPNHFINTGTNVKIENPGSRRFISSRELRMESGKRTASPLFIWTVILIVTPLLLTTITISAVVISTMSREFDESVKDSEAHFLDVAVQALSLYVGLRADFVSTYTSRSVRDLYLMTRLGSWIMFDGLERADSFTEAVTAVNECLEAESSGTCPWAIENRVCDCAWKEDLKCENYSEVTSRSLQIPYFFASSDAALPNGTRFSTGFPNVSASPNTTLWWGGPYELPGSENNESASDFSTTFSRIRKISSFNLFPVLYNYDIKKENSNGHYFAFEEDVSRALYMDLVLPYNSSHWTSHL